MYFPPRVESASGEDVLFAQFLKGKNQEDKHPKAEADLNETSPQRR